MVSLYLDYPEISNLIKNDLLKKEKIDAGLESISLAGKELFRVEDNNPYLSVADGKGGWCQYYPRQGWYRKEYIFNKQGDNKNPSWAFVENRFDSKTAFGHSSVITAIFRNDKYEINEAGFQPDNGRTALNLPLMADSLVVPSKGEVIGSWSWAQRTDGKNKNAIGVKFPNYDCARHWEVDVLVDALSMKTSKPTYKYLATSVGNAINCSSYAIRSLKRCGVFIKKELGINGLVKAPGELGAAVMKLLGPEIIEKSANASCKEDAFALYGDNKGNMLSLHNDGEGSYLKHKLDELLNGKNISKKVDGQSKGAYTFSFGDGTKMNVDVIQKQMIHGK